MELCDLFDENRNPLGRTHDRSMPLAEGEYILAAGVWVINSQNEILLTKRAPTKNFAPNRWENTGGHVMAGESSRQTAARELREETGIVAEASELIFLASIKNKPFFGDDYALFRDVDLGDIVLQEGETCDVRWASWEQVEAIINKGQLSPATAKSWRQTVRPALEKLKNHKVN